MANGARTIVAKKPPKLSLIVATLGRADELRKLLNSLVDQRSTDFEVVVVDQSHDMGQIGCLVNEFSEQLRVAYLIDEGTGLSRARNIGLRHARGEYLGFPDDDCWFDRGVVEAVEKFFQRNPDITILSGIYTEPGRENCNFPVDSSALSGRNLFDKVCSVGTFIRRDGAGAIPLEFDECIGAGTRIPAGEEVDLVLRLLLGGVEGFYDPSLIIFHPISREKYQSEHEYLALRKAFWYVIGKNYRPVYSESKLVRGILGSILRRSRYGIATELRAVVEGFREGFCARA